MDVETKKVNINLIKENKDNPRKINKKEFELLKKSLQDFPEMLSLREIVVDENMMILGGNMRYRALKELGEKEVIIKIVTGLSEAQKKEFILKDNVSYGEWDIDDEKEIGWNDIIKDLELNDFIEIDDDDDLNILENDELFTKDHGKDFFKKDGIKIVIGNYTHFKNSNDKYYNFIKNIEKYLLDTGNINNILEILKNNYV